MATTRIEQRSSVISESSSFSNGFNLRSYFFGTDIQGPVCSSTFSTGSSHEIKAPCRVVSWRARNVMDHFIGDSTWNYNTSSDHCFTKYHALLSITIVHLQLVLDWRVLVASCAFLQLSKSKVLLSLWRLNLTQNLQVKSTYVKARPAFTQACSQLTFTSGAYPDSTGGRLSSRKYSIVHTAQYRIHRA